jgi:hypothetical protein|tara:strand:- start:7566 stop:11201 length:3636 start_codon:yes stop_codon:yes gene_type:complete
MALTYNAETGEWNLKRSETTGEWELDDEGNVSAFEKTNYEDNIPLIENPPPVFEPTNFPETPEEVDSNYPLKQDHKQFYKDWVASNDSTAGINGALRGLYATYFGRFPTQTEIDDWKTGLEATYGWEYHIPNERPGLGTGWVAPSVGKTIFTILDDAISTSEERIFWDDLYAANKETNLLTEAKASDNIQANIDNKKINDARVQIYNDRREYNEAVEESNAFNRQLNIDNAFKNAAYALMVDQLAPNSKGGYYIDERSKFDKENLVSGKFFEPIIQELKDRAEEDGLTIDVNISEERAEELQETLRGAYRNFYVTDILRKWNPKFGEQPPYADYLINKETDALLEALKTEAPTEEQEELLKKYSELDKDNFLEDFDPVNGSFQDLKDFIELSGAATTGGFDAKFYASQAPNVKEAWDKAVEEDDVDIVERYGEKNYYWQHYTQVGKAQGLRGNQAEDTARADAYQEGTKDQLDADIQSARDLQLGFQGNTITDRLFEIQVEDENGDRKFIVKEEWDKARRGDPYWKELAINNYLDVEDKDQFAALFRLSDDPLFKGIVFQVNQSPGGITDLEQAIQQAAGEKAQVDAQKFGALNQAILRDTIEEMKKQRAEQETLSFYKGFNTFSEIFDMNKTLADSILGDSGVGGILSFTSAGKAEEDLLENLNELSGVRNSVQYNWTRWFDEAIKEKYGIDYSVFEPLEEQMDVISAFTDEKTTKKVWNANQNTFDQDFLDRAGFKTTEDLVSFLEEQGDQGATILTTIQGDPGDEAKSVLDPISSVLEEDIKTIEEQKDRGLVLGFETEDRVQMMNIEAEFARRYIDNYLTPRFDTSRSMDEFVEYLDVRQEEKNPFQTQDTYSALQTLADLQANAYINTIQQTQANDGARVFDPNFYFDPIPDPSNEEEYLKQKTTVNEDWDKAKAGDDYWNAQAYRFGIDINNKAAFARMHFEVKGQGEGFDPAEDYINAGKVRNFIFDTVLPTLEKEAEKGDPVFGQFITPEEFADEMLRGLDPSNTPAEWQELLQRYGLESFEGDIEELREYIIEILRTGSAQKIREEIKYLNEKRQRPTQEILGVTYIQRDEDFKDEKAKPTTQLYSTFQKAGYEGTEDEFYEKFFPDLDRSEQITLTKAGKDEALEAYGLDLSDPFASFGTIESFFPEDAKEARKEAEEESPAEKYTSYFRIGVDDDEDEDYMSDTGEEFLSEFTSMFKGLG